MVLEQTIERGDSRDAVKELRGLSKIVRGTPLEERVAEIQQMAKGN